MRRPLLIAAMLACALLAAPATADARTTRAERTLEAINDARADHGLKPVRMSKKASRRARSYASTMLRYDRWAHAAQPARGSGFSEVGEMLGRSTVPGGGVRSIVAMWLASPDHRAILLTPRYRYAGIGVRKGEFEGRTSRVWVVRLGCR